MVNTQLAFSVLQLVALALPAFAILLQMVVESEIAYTHLAVPITTAGMGLFLVAGAIILGELLLTTPSAIAQFALGIILLGILTMLVGACLIGYQTEKKQRRIQVGN
ncbi:hypothetical protein [Halorussus sp. AFM4]|uniref:hypothetical protein n=1 Tax=Halorussus sp. AFM4 TaxID=3421651 RepID=UPI003EBA4404